MRRFLLTCVLSQLHYSYFAALSVHAPQGSVRVAARNKGLQNPALKGQNLLARKNKLFICDGNLSRDLGLLWP